MNTTVLHWWLVLSILSLFAIVQPTGQSIILTEDFVSGPAFTGATTGTNAVSCLVTIDDVFTTDPSCDSSTDGEIEIDASGMELSGNLVYSINNGASFQVSNLFSTLGTGTYNIIVQDSSDPECFATTSVTLTATVIPNPSPSPLLVCVTLVPPNGEVLNLDAIIDEIRNFDPNYTVHFYYDMDGMHNVDLTDPADIIELINLIPATIFATITDGTCESSTVPVSINYSNYPTPPNGMLEECSVGGNATFTLSNADDQFTGGNPYLTVSYHSTLGSAENGDNPIFILTISSNLTVFVRVEKSDGCASTAELDLIITTAPTPNNASLNVCDDGSGQALFDLTSVDVDVLGGSSGDVIYYENSELTIEIVDPANFISGPTTVFAVIDDGSGCLSDASEVTLDLISFDINNAFLTFDTNGDCQLTNVTIVLNTPSDPPGDYSFDVSYGPTSTGANNAVVLTGSTGDVGFTLDISESHVFQINSVTSPGPDFCEITLSTPFEYIIDTNQAPDAFPASITACESSADEGFFDLTTLENAINGNTSSSVSFYQDINVTMPINNPSNYLSAEGTIFAVVESVLGCISMPVAIQLFIDEFPVPVDISLSIDDACGATITVLTFELPNGGGYDVDLLVTGDSGTNVVTLTNIANQFTYEVYVSETTTFSIAEVTSESGCNFTLSTSPSVTINISGSLSSEITLDQIIRCNGNNDGGISLNIFGESPFNIDWSDDTYDDLHILTGLSAGTYRVTITDNDGCTSFNSITLDNPAPLLLDCVANDVDEGNGIGSYTFSYSGGTPVYTFNLNGPTNLNFTNNTAGSWDSAPLPPGDYTFTITDQNGCSESCSFNVPVICDLSVGIESVDPNCTDEANGSIDLSIDSSEPIVSIDWNINEIDGEINPTGLAAGNYTVTITDEAGCNEEASITLNNPAPLILGCTPNSAGEGSGIGSYTFTYSGGTPFYTIELTGPIEVFFTENNPGSWDTPNLPLGDYTLVITDRNGCSESCDFTLSIDCDFTVEVDLVNPSCTGEANGSIDLVIDSNQPIVSIDWNVDEIDGETNPTDLLAGTYTAIITDVTGCSQEISIVLNDPAPLFLDCHPNTEGEGNGDGSYTFFYSGGTPGYIINLNGPIDSSFPENNPGSWNTDVLPQGNYIFTLRDQNGCSVSCSFTVSDNCNFILGIDGTDPNCHDDATGSIDLTINSSLPIVGIDWNVDEIDGETNPTGLTAGIYSVTVTDQSGCNQEASITLNNPLPLVLFCNENNEGQGNGPGSYSFTFSGGTPGYTLELNGPLNINFAQNNPGTWNSGVLPPGEYTFTVTDSNGCSTVCSFSPPDNCEFTVDVDSSNPICVGDASGSIDLEISSSLPIVSIDWNLDEIDGQASPTGLTAGTYTVTIRDVTGCSQAFSITLNDPGPLNLVCRANNEGQGNGPGSHSFFFSGGTPTYDLNLSGPNTNIDIPNTITPWNSEVLSPGDYVFTITDQNGCSESCNFIIPPICDFAIDIDWTNPLCAGEATGSINLMFDSSDTIVSIDWNIDEIDGEANPSGLAAGTYTAVVTDQTGCSQESSITISDPTPLVLDCHLNNEGEGSGPGSYTFTYSGGMPFYALELIGPTNIFFTENTPGSWGTAVLESGTYTFNLSDQNGCSESCTFFIPISCDVTIDIDKIDPNCQGEANGSIDLDINSSVPIVSIDWNVDEIDGEFNPTGLTEGTYMATIEDQLGCSEEVSILLNDPSPLILDCRANTIDEGIGIGSYTFFYSGGTPYYTLHLNGPANINYTENSSGSWDSAILPPGDYTFTLTDRNGCSEVCSFSIPPICDLTVSIEGTDPNCVDEAGGSIDLTINSSAAIASIDWNFDEIDGEANPTGLIQGTYTATVVDSIGCSEEVSIILDALELPYDFNCSVETPPSDSTSTDGSIDIMINSGPVGPYTITYDNGMGVSGNVSGMMGSNIISNLPDGNYQITISNGTCEVTCEVVLVTDFCTFDLTTIPTDETCAGENDGIITAIPSGGQTPYTFLWSNGETTASIDSLPPGNFSVTVMDGNDCTAIDTQMISTIQALPILMTAPGGLVCTDSCYRLPLNFTGQAPFVVDYQIDQGMLTAMVQQSFVNNTDTLILCPESEGINPGDFTLTFTHLADANCSDTLSQAINFTYLAPAVEDLNLTICPGDSLDVNGQFFFAGNTSGQVLLPSAAMSGCDSIVNVNIDFYPENITDLTSNICAGDTLQIGEQAFYAGNLTGGVTLENADINGCDSIINLTVIETEAVIENINPSICPGDSILIAGVFFSELHPTDTILLEGQADSGCDSLVAVSINILPEPIGNLTLEICPGDSVTFNGVVFSEMMLTDTVSLDNAASNGCDSLVIVNTNVLPEPIGNLTLEICPGDSITFNGLVFSEMMLTDTVSLDNAASNGCDSLVIVNTNVLPEPIGNLTLEICPGDSITFNGVVFSEMMLTDTVALDNAASNGCDSLVIVNTNVLPEPIGNLTLEICPGDSITFNGLVFSEMMLTDTVSLDNAASNGCDSLVIVDLNILAEPIGTFTADICPGDSLLLGGEYFHIDRLSDTLRLEAQAINGCDSILQVNLEIADAIVFELLSTLCPGDSLMVGDTTIRDAGQYEVLLMGGAASGCDSIVQVDLMYYPPAVSDFVSVACASDTIQVGDQQFTIDDPGETVTLAGAASNGCDSLVMVDITFLPNSLNSIDSLLCFGESLLVGGTLFDADNPSGVVFLESSSATGCDSTIFVNTSYQNELFAELSPDITICGDQEATVLLQLTAGDSYAFQIDQTPGSSILETNISSATYTIDLGTISSSTTLSLSSISAASGCPVTVLNEQSTINYSNSQLTLSSVGGGLNGNDISCADAFDGAINLSIDNGIGPFTYLWNNGATEANLTGLGAGTYSVTVNDLPGCSTSAELTLNAPPPIVIIATGEAGGCEGTNTGVLLIDTIFGGSGPYEYSIDGQFFSAVDNYPVSIANLASGGYTIYVQDANDCQSNLPIGVPNGISLQLELGDDVTISLGDSVLLNPLYDFVPASWNWTPDIDISQPDTFVTYAAPQETTVYQLEMADENGCTTIDQIRIFVENNIDIFIPNAFAPTGSGGNEKLTIYAGKGVESIERFQIFDRWGNQVFGEGPFQPNDPTYGWDGRLNGQIMNAAVFVYYVEVLLTNGKTVVLKGDVMLMR